MTDNTVAHYPGSMKSTIKNNNRHQSNWVPSLTGPFAHLPVKGLATTLNIAVELAKAHALFPPITADIRDETLNALGFEEWQMAKQLLEVDFAKKRKLSARSTRKHLKRCSALLSVLVASASGMKHLPLQEAALKQNRQRPEGEHPTILSAMSNLVQTYQSASQLWEARSLHEAG